MTLSSDGRGDASDDKVILFDGSSNRTRRSGKFSGVESPIRQYIRSIEMKLETRMNSKKAPRQANNRTMLAADKGRAHKAGFIGDFAKVEIEKAAKLNNEQCSSSHSAELDDATATFPAHN